MSIELTTRENPNNPNMPHLFANGAPVFFVTREPRQIPSFRRVCAPSAEAKTWDGVAKWMLAIESERYDGVCFYASVRLTGRESVKIPGTDLYGFRAKLVTADGSTIFGWFSTGSVSFLTEIDARAIRDAACFA